MKNIFLTLLSLLCIGILFLPSARSQSVSALTQVTTPAFDSRLSISRTNGAGGWITRSIKIENLLNVSNKSYTVGDYFALRGDTPSEPAQLLFVKYHNTTSGHGVLALGGISGDVVCNPTSSDGVFQIGVTGNAGNWIYMQHANAPYAAKPLGFSHTLHFVCRSTNTAAANSFDYKYPGITGFADGQNASRIGQLKFYGEAPHWNYGNHNPDAPDYSGTLSLTVTTQYIASASGVKFIGNGGSLTNDAGATLGSGGGSGLTTNIVTWNGNTPLVQYFTNGGLSSIVTDTDASNYIAAVVAAGGTLTDSQKLAVSKFTVSRKWSGTWSDADVIAPMMGGTAAAHLIVLKGTNTMTYANTPTHNANGVTFNGTDNYINTGWTPSISANYSQDSARLVYVIPTSSATPTGSLEAFGSSVSTTGGAKYAGLYRNNPAAISGTGNNNGNGNAWSLSNTDCRGVLMSTRESSTAQYGYFWQHTVTVGGSALSTTGFTTASTGAPTRVFSLGSRSYEGFVNDQFQAFTISGFEAGAKCTSTQAQAIRDAWAQLQIDLAR